MLRWVSAGLLVACTRTPSPDTKAIPPQSRPEPDAPQAVEQRADAPDQSDAVSPASSAPPSMPSGPCRGDSAETRKLLAQRAGDSRVCYEHALRRDPKLTARIRLNVRLDEAGNSWAHLSEDSDLADEEMKACILELFRRPFASPPNGGCMDAIIPVNFVAKPKAP